MREDSFRIEWPEEIRQGSRTQFQWDERSSVVDISFTCGDNTPNVAQAGNWPFLVPFRNASGARLEQIVRDKKSRNLLFRLRLLVILVPRAGLEPA